MLVIFLFVIYNSFMNKKVNIEWWMKSYDNRQKPQRIMAMSLLLSLVTLIAGIVITVLLMSAVGDSVWIYMGLDIATLVSLFGAIFELRSNARKIKELVEIERVEANVPPVVVAKYMELIKITTFQMRVPKKKVQEFKEFLIEYNKKATV